MRSIGSARPLLLAAFTLLCGCQAASDYRQDVGAPVSGASASCESGCNREYDACMDRFSGIPGSQRYDQPMGNPRNDFGVNGVCPDQLKSCLKRCTP